MDLAASIEEYRQEEMEQAIESPTPSGPPQRWTALRLRSLSLPAAPFRPPLRKLCKNHPKEPKPNQAPGAMNPGAMTHTLRCHLLLAQYV